MASVDVPRPIGSVWTSDHRETARRSLAVAGVKIGVILRDWHGKDEQQVLGAIREIYALVASAGRSAEQAIDREH